MIRQKPKILILSVVAIFTAVAQGASIAHMLPVYGYANEGLMCWIVAILVVLMSNAFAALGVITKDKTVRWVLNSGIVLLTIVECVGNGGVGGLKTMEHMPPSMAYFFGIDTIAMQRIGAFLFGGFLPIIIFVSVYAVGEIVCELLRDGHNG